VNIVNYNDYITPEIEKTLSPPLLARLAEVRAKE